MSFTLTEALLLARKAVAERDLLRELAEACVDEHNRQGWTQKQALYELEKYLRATLGGESDAD